MKELCIIFLLPLFMSNYISDNSHENPKAMACPHEYDSLAKMIVYTYVDKEPEYPGGSPELMKFIAKNFHYPNQDDFQGSFQIQFVVDKQGSIIAARIKEKKQSNLTLAEKELLKVVYKMPKWNSGRCRGRVVPVKITLPVYL
jgi:protein TonB